MVRTQLGNLGSIEGVLALQEQNLYRNLSPQAREGGFVTTPFTKGQLKEIIRQKGLFVATNETDKVVGYIFGGSWDYFRQWAIFEHMISRFPQLAFQDEAITTENSFQYGPVCIENSYRGQGVFKDLFEAMRIELVQRYPISVTFINQINAVSSKAHQKLGWKVIDQFEFNDNKYDTLAYDMKQSVL